MKKKKKEPAKPVKLSKRAEVARIKRSLWVGDRISAAALRAGLQSLLDDDPENLWDAEFMFGLLRGCPQHAEIICTFTHPALRKEFAKSTYVQKQPQLRKAFIDDVKGIKQAKPEEDKKDKKSKLFRK